jgi:cell division control protein 6
MTNFTLDSYLKPAIIINHDALREDFIPEEIIHRKEQFDGLARSIFAPIKNNRSGSPGLFCQGTSGTGKTVAVKFMKEVLEKERGDVSVKVIYINCSEFKSQTQIAKKLYEESIETASKKYSCMEYLKLFFKEIDKKYKFLVLILDEVDNILPKIPSEDQFFYCLIRAREIEWLKNTFQSIICVANDVNCREKLAEGTRSSFGINWLHFPRYKYNEIYDILQQRAKVAFIPNAISEELLQEISKFFADRGGNLREAISLLKFSAEIADESGEKQITSEDFYKARGVYEDFSMHEKLAFFVLTSCYDFNKKPVTFSNINETYNKLCEKLKREPTDSRQVRNYLKKLLSLNLIDEFTETGKLFYKPLLSSSTIKGLLDDMYKSYAVKAEDFIRENKP